MSTINKLVYNNYNIMKKSYIDKYFQQYFSKEPYDINIMSKD